MYMYVTIRLGLCLWKAVMEYIAYFLIYEIDFLVYEIPFLI